MSAKRILLNEFALASPSALSAHTQMRLAQSNANLRFAFSKASPAAMAERLPGAGRVLRIFTDEGPAGASAPCAGAKSISKPLDSTLSLGF